MNTATTPTRPARPILPAEVLTNVNHQMSVMREESFGPIVGIMKVRNDDEAIALMNDSPYGLTASIWTADTEHAIAIGDRVETGTVFMNRCDYLDPALVWTGVKDTGKGGSALGHRLRQSDPAEVLSPARKNLIRKTFPMTKCFPNGTTPPPSASAPAASRSCPTRWPLQASSARSSSPTPGWRNCRSSHRR